MSRIDDILSLELFLEVFPNRVSNRRGFYLMDDGYELTGHSAEIVEIDFGAETAEIKEVGRDY